MSPPANDRYKSDHRTTSFGDELTQWREQRGLSQKDLAEKMKFSPSYVCKVERGQILPSEKFAQKAEAALRTGEALWRVYCDMAEVQPFQSPQNMILKIVEENAGLRYSEGIYRCTVQRRLYNAGQEPVVKFPVDILVDRYPDDHLRSVEYYRRNPLTIDELQFTAIHSSANGDEPMNWYVSEDHDSYKEITLLFRNNQTQFALYPGEYATIRYSFQASADKWGPWFERKIKMDTERLLARLEFPAGTNARVQARRKSYKGDEEIGAVVVKPDENGYEVHELTRPVPLLGDYYRLSWRTPGD